jgi:glutaconate CoA-transferase subunit A
MTETDKVMSVREAVDRFIDSGDKIGLCGTGYHYPSAVAREIARQGVDDLICWSASHETAMGGGDMLAGLGLVSEMHAAWVGNFAVASGYGVREGLNEHGMELQTYSNLAAAQSIMAAAYGLPFMPTRSMANTDTGKYCDNLEFVTDENGREYPIVRAADIEIGIIVAPRADKLGNAQLWATEGVHARPLAQGAADKVIVQAEEIVSTEVTRSDPDRTVTQNDKVVAVCEVPWGGHPGGVRPVYSKDVPFQTHIGNRVKEEGYEEVAKDWVYGVDDNEEYIEKYIEEFGKDALENLKPDNHRFSAPIDYSYQNYSTILGGDD